MVSGALSLIADLRDESSFLPAITFGYLYSKGSEIAVCTVGLDSMYVFTGFSRTFQLVLAIASLVTAMGTYSIAKSNKSSSKIRQSATKKFGHVLDVVVVIDSGFTILAPILLLFRICQGDLIANTLLLIQIAILGTTLWSYLLYRYTSMGSFKGMAK